MARTKSGTNKAQAIRDYFNANPNASGVAVVEALGKKGIKVAPAQVSNVKTAMKKKSKGPKKAKAKEVRGGGDGVGVKQVLDAAFVLLDQMSAEEAAELLSRLSNGKQRAK